MSDPTPEEIEEKRQRLEEAREREEMLREHARRDREKFYGLQIHPEVSYYDDAPQREPGQDNWVGFGFDLHPQVSVISVALLTAFVAVTLSYRAEAVELFESLLASITAAFGWFYILTANVIVVAMVVFALGRYGRIRIGGPDARPEFSDFGWYSMLISAGMGIGLMFWSIAEPLYHYGSPSPMFGVEAHTPEAAQAAFAVTYYHWGLHPWAIYALVGLALAFFAFNRGLPLTIRSVFYPLLGERIHGWWGNWIDILSVLATLCGLATSLGLGVKQVAAGLDFLFPLPAAAVEVPLASTAEEGTAGHEALRRTRIIVVDGEEIALQVSPDAPPLYPRHFRKHPRGPSRELFEAYLPDAELHASSQLSALLSPPDREALARRWRALYRAWSRALDRAEAAQTPEEAADHEARAAAWRAHMETLEKGTRARPNTGFLVLLIALITSFATMSVVAGLDEGVQRLSVINIYLAGGMMLFLLVFGPTLFILSAFTQNLGYYLQSLPQLSLWTEVYRETALLPGEDPWQAGWTLFYWGWWISWSPFVGMFIARISKGRTVREFILGVMLLPTLLSFLWMSTFGGTALHLQLTGVGDIESAVSRNVATALFEMLRYLPLTEVASLVGICLVTFFFVTSSDSGSLVVDHLTSGGKLDSPVPQRVFWAIMEGLLAAVLLMGGGLVALQTASITTGLPFALILLIMIYSLRQDLLEELFQLDTEAERRAAEDELRKHKAVAVAAVHEHAAVVQERKDAEEDLAEAVEAAEAAEDDPDG